MKIEGGNTSNALLGVLSLRPMSGYDMRRLISESIGHFWSESYGQIYPGLKTLAAAGLVKKMTERQKGKPDRHVYSLTESGRRHLREWLQMPPTPEVRRDELLLKLFFGRHVKPGISREHVEAKLTAELNRIKTYAAMAKQLRRERAGDPQLPYCMITLNRGLHGARANVKWCRETLQELDRLEKVETR